MKFRLARIQCISFYTFAEFSCTAKSFMLNNPSSMATADDDCADSQFPGADDDGLDDGSENSSIDKSCLVCGKSEPPSKEDTKEQLQPNSDSSPREKGTHDKSLNYTHHLIFVSCRRNFTKFAS